MYFKKDVNGSRVLVKVLLSFSLLALSACGQESSTPDGPIDSTVSEQTSNSSIDSTASEQAANGSINSITSEPTEFVLPDEFERIPERADPVEFVETDADNEQALVDAVTDAGESGDSQVTASTETEAETEAETCLLYTSPSPRDKRQSRMPSSA